MLHWPHRRDHQLLEADSMCLRRCICEREKISKVQSSCNPCRSLASTAEYRMRDRAGAAEKKNRYPQGICGSRVDAQTRRSTCRSSKSHVGKVESCVLCNLFHENCNDGSKLGTESRESGKQLGMVPVALVDFPAVCCKAPVEFQQLYGTRKYVFHTALKRRAGTVPLYHILCGT